MPELKEGQVIKLIRGFIVKWIELLKLQNWSIDVNYMKGHGEMIDGNFRTHAVCSSTWHHMTARIQFWPKDLRDESESYIEYVVVHELLHIVVNEMRDKGINHEERVVSHLAKAVLGINNA